MFGAHSICMIPVRYSGQNSKATRVPPLFTLVTSCGIAMSLCGCAVIEGIFKAGVWVGVFAVAGVIGLIVWGLSAAFR
jgi:hypothetical protein